MDPVTPLSQTSHWSKITQFSDAALVESVAAASFTSGLEYNAAFRQHWLQRWHYLRQQLKLSVADIAAQPAMLLAPLHDILSSR